MKTLIIATADLENWVDKTLRYLESDRGKENWKANTARGYNFDTNLFAAVMTATRLRMYERISEVVIEIKRLSALARWAA